MEPEKPASREQGGDQTVGDHGTEAEAFEKTERGARGARRQRWVAALVLGLGGVGVGGGRVLGASSLKRRTTRSPRGAEIRNRQTRAVRRVREVGRAAHDSSSRWPSLRASLELPRWANLRPQGVARQAQTRGLGAGRAISPFDARARRRSLCLIACFACLPACLPASCFTARCCCTSSARRLGSGRQQTAVTRAQHPTLEVYSGGQRAPLSQARGPILGEQPVPGRPPSSRVSWRRPRALRVGPPRRCQAQARLLPVCC